ncbi:hypothetical protein LTR33_017613 [Friedmanniomyces endolithicus]|nr:hypothetical protein LTR03_017874 [Friedmanniomyces endolithicus]KAK1026399.1 hypothetical protein LTR33_017613 [Friedmanniomyces endolithicus]
MALSRQQTTTSIPLSIKEISLQAAQFDFSPNVALQRWIRAAKMLLTEAALCEQDGNLQKAYLYLVRHADLVLERLPHHPDYRDPHFKPDLMEAQRAVQRNFHKLDDWRPGLVQQYERYESAIERWEVEQQRLEQEREASRQSADQSRQRSAVFDDSHDAVHQQLIQPMKDPEGVNLQDSRPGKLGFRLRLWRHGEEGLQWPVMVKLATTVAEFISATTVTILVFATLVGN